MPDTVSEITPLVRIYAGERGTCSTAKVFEYLNKAESLLWDKTHFSATMEWACVRCVDGCWTVPSRYKQVFLAFYGGNPVSLGNEWFQSVPQIGIGGGGGNGWGGRKSCHQKFIQEGGTHVTFRDYHEHPYQIAFQAESQLDKGVEITPTFRNNYDTVVTETVALGDATTFVKTENLSKAVIAMVKPRTEGRVRMYAWDNNTDTRTLLAVYEPYDINPTFRRFRVNGKGCECLTIYAKKKRVPLIAETDLLTFPTEAIIHAMQAVVWREANDLQKFADELAVAVAELNRSDTDDEQSVGSPLRIFAPDEVYSLTPGVWGGSGWGGGGLYS